MAVLQIVITRTSPDYFNDGVVTFGGRFTILLITFPGKNLQKLVNFVSLSTDTLVKKPCFQDRPNVFTPGSGDDDHARTSYVQPSG